MIPERHQKGKGKMMGRVWRVRTNNVRKAEGKPIVLLRSDRMCAALMSAYFSIDSQTGGLESERFQATRNTKDKKASRLALCFFVSFVAKKIPAGSALSARRLRFLRSSSGIDMLKWFLALGFRRQLRQRTTTCLIAA